MPAQYGKYMKNATLKILYPNVYYLRTRNMLAFMINLLECMFLVTAGNYMFQWENELGEWRSRRYSTQFILSPGPASIC